MVFELNETLQQKLFNTQEENANLNSNLVSLEKKIEVYIHIFNCEKGIKDK